MTKTLVLRPRNIRRIQTDKGIRDVPMWHDVFLLTTAIEAIAKGKAFSKAALWLGTAAKFEMAKESQENFDEELPEIEVELRNTETKLLWRELCKLPSEAFSRNRRTGAPEVPNAAYLYFMMQDIAEQLGYDMPGADDEEE